MATINLTAKGETERRLLAYLQENASEALAEKIHASGKSLGDAVRYCADQAQSMRTGNSAMVDDAAVFGWVIHYFEDVAGASPTVPAKRGSKKAAPDDPVETETEEGTDDEISAAAVAPAPDDGNGGLFSDVDFGVFGGAK